jgi:hypothetical protein
MLLIFGFRTYVQTLAMLRLACINGHTAGHRLARRTRKFTLFFIPLFPVSVKYFTLCTACGEQLKLSKAEAMQLQAQAASSAAAAPAPATDPVTPPLYAPAPAPAAPPAPPASRERPSPTPRPRRQDSGGAES